MDNEKNKQHRYRDIAEWLEALLFAFVLIVLLYTFLFRVISVSGGSMETTLNENDRVVVQCIAYKPKHGDVIVVDSYSDYGKPLVKRIIAMEGDTVDIDFSSGEVSVNGSILSEPYISSPTTDPHDVSFPLIVDEGHVFVLGDNRAVSLDSRSSDVGLIDVRDILGKAVLRIYPFKEFGTIK